MTQPELPELPAHDLLDRIIADVAYIDSHRPPEPMLWLLAEIVEAFAGFVRWREALTAQEHAEADAPPP